MTAITQKSSNPLAARTTKDTLFERALSVVWNVRHPLSPFCESLLPVPDRLTYQTQDNHRVTIERFPNSRGRGEPILICTGPLIHSRILRLGEGQFLRSLQENGFDTNNTKDELYDEAVKLVIREQKASTSFIQRYFRIGYNRAATIIEKMEENNIISKPGRAGKRDIISEK